MPAGLTASVLPPTYIFVESVPSQKRVCLRCSTSDVCVTLVSVNSSLGSWANRIGARLAERAAQDRVVEAKGNFRSV